MHLNVPWAKLKDMRIESINNPNGLEHDSFGTVYFWIGNELTEISGLPNSNKPEL